MSKDMFIVSPILLMIPDQKKDEGERPFSRKDLKSASERLRIPTPSQRLLKD